MQGKDGSPATAAALRKALDILQESFDPIIDLSTGRDLLPVMVYAQELGAWDYTGMYSVLLKHQVRSSVPCRQSPERGLRWSAQRAAQAPVQCAHCAVEAPWIFSWHAKRAAEQYLLPRCRPASQDLRPWHECLHAEWAGLYAQHAGRADSCLRTGEKIITCLVPERASSSGSRSSSSNSSICDS